MRRGRQRKEMGAQKKIRQQVLRVGFLELTVL